MLDQTIQTIEQRILQVFPAGHSYSKTQIKEARLPSGVKHFLLSALQRRSEIEAAQLLNVRSEWFNADDDEYQLVLQQAVLTLGNSACFPALEWPKAVHQAVEHVVEYLISPVSMLARFVFSADSASISASDLLRKSGYFSDYSYLSRAVEAYISRKNSQRVFKVEFANALYHIDRQMTDAYDSKAWLKLLNPLIKLVDFPTPGLPVSFVVRFFEDKGQGQLSQYLNEAASAKHADMVSIESLTALIDHFLSDAGEPAQESNQEAQASSALPADHPAEPEKKGEASVAPSTLAQTPAAPQRPMEPAPASPLPPLPQPLPAPPPLPPAPPPPPPQKESESQPEPAPSGTTGDENTSPRVPLPLWKKFQKAETPSDQVVAPIVSEPLWKTFSRKKEERAAKEKLDLANAMPIPEPRPDIEALVLGSANAHKERFIWQLFAGNHAAFDATMQLLATAPDWTSASEIIANKVFRPFKVDIYSATAVDFTNAVESRYSGLRS